MELIEQREMLNLDECDPTTWPACVAASMVELHKAAMALDSWLFVHTEVDDAEAVDDPMADLLVYRKNKLTDFEKLVARKTRKNALKRLQRSREYLAAGVMSRLHFDLPSDLALGLENTIKDIGVQNLRWPHKPTFFPKK